LCNSCTACGSLLLLRCCQALPVLFCLPLRAIPLRFALPLYALSALCGAACAAPERCGGVVRRRAPSYRCSAKAPSLSHLLSRLASHLCGRRRWAGLPWRGVGARRQADRLHGEELTGKREAGGRQRPAGRAPVPAKRTSTAIRCILRRWHSWCHIRLCLCMRADGRRLAVLLPHVVRSPLYAFRRLCLLRTLSAEHSNFSGV